jgi:hypothetical protein
MGADECGFGEVADSAGADGDVSEGAPALAERGEPAFAEAAQRPQELVVQVDLLPFLAQRLDADAAGVDGLAVEDQVRRSVGLGPLPGLEQVRRLRATPRAGHEP